MTPMSKPRSKRTLAVAIAALAVAGGGGAALGAGGSSPASSFLDDVARHLGISTAKLQDATKAAALDQVNAALKAGRITQAQADALEARIESGELPFFGRALGGFGLFGLRERPFAFGEKVTAAADYLGLTVDELRNRLAQGQSLAQVAKAQGKSVDGLEQAILAVVKKRVDAAVSAGTLTQDQAKAVLDRAQARIARLVNRTFPAPGFGWRFFGGPGPRGFFFRPRGGGGPPSWGAAA
jgi:ABC-type amino acid transport substrate-binding protein